MLFDFILDDDYWDDADKRRARLAMLRTSISMKDWKLDTWRRVDNAPIGTWCRRPEDLVEVAEYQTLMFLEQSDIAYANFGGINNHDTSLDSKVLSMLDDLAEERTTLAVIDALGWNKYEKGTPTEREKARQAVQDTVDAGKLVKLVLEWAVLSEAERKERELTSDLLNQTFTDAMKKHGYGTELN